MRKLPTRALRRTCVTPCTVRIEDNDAPSMDGAPVVALEWSGKCRFSEKTSGSISGDKREVTLFGAIQLIGDIVPDLPSVSTGSVDIFDVTHRIHKGMRPRNPDGTVHHTTLELI